MTTEEMDRLLTLLRVPSVGALEEHEPDMHVAAGLIADEIQRAGGTTRVERTLGHPFVVGEIAPSDDRPDPVHVLIYGHYDVQPVGDLARWDSPPFEPTVRGDHLYARGASDNKGNLFQVIVAVQRLVAEGRLPVRVTFLVEGEEETSGLSAIRWIDELDDVPDIAIIWDGGMLAPEVPAIETGVRGLSYHRVTVRCGTLDGHSGIFGGAAMNALHALMRVLSAVVPHDGVLPAPLLEGIAPVSELERDAWGRMPTGASLLGDAGLIPADAEAASEFALRTLASPSVDVHSVWAGDADAVKTVIPTVAHAMISIRLAPGQDTASVGQTLVRLMSEAAPAGATCEVETLNTADAALMDPEHPVMQTAARAIETATGYPVLPVRSGGTLPIFASMVAKGMPTILTGFTLPDDAIHSPNERMLIANLGTGVRAGMAMLEAFGR